MRISVQRLEKRHAADQLPAGRRAVDRLGDAAQLDAAPAMRVATLEPASIAGMSRPAALEFSFFLSMPTMAVATGYDFLKSVIPHHHEAEIAPLTITPHQWIVLAIGLVVSFFVALAVVAAVYTAFLFAQAKGRDFWQNPLLSVHLLAHALLAGSAVWPGL